MNYKIKCPECDNKLKYSKLSIGYYCWKCEKLFEANTIEKYKKRR